MIAISLLVVYICLPLLLIEQEVAKDYERTARDGYTARVERVEPAIPGLLVEPFPSANGALKITNGTGQDVYIWYAVPRVGKGPAWHRVPPGQDMLLAGEVEYGGFRDRQPMGTEPGQVMKTWALRGRVGEAEFVIYGVTVYDPLPP